MHFETIEVQTCSAPQNDHLNLSCVDREKLARNGRKPAIYHLVSSQKNIFAFSVITFEPMEVQNRSAPQKNRMNLSFVKVDGGKLARNGRKTAILAGGWRVVTN